MISEVAQSVSLQFQWTRYWKCAKIMQILTVNIHTTATMLPAIPRSLFKYLQPSHNSQLIPSCLKNNTNRQSWGTFLKNIFYFLQHFVSKPEFNSDLFYFLKVSFPFTAAKSCVTQTTKGRGITFIPHSHLSFSFSGNVRDHTPGPDFVRHQARHRPADLWDRHPHPVHQQETQPGKNENNFRVLNVKWNLYWVQSLYIYTII